MEENPAFGQVRLSYQTTQPQLFIQVDRERASDLGIDIDGLGETLQAVLDGTSVGSVFIDDRSHDVMLISTTSPVSDPTDLENMFLQTASGEIVPMSTVVTLEERADRAAAPPRGASCARSRSPPRSTTAWRSARPTPWRRRWRRRCCRRARGSCRSPRPRRWARPRTACSITFGFALLVIFLVLAAQFESFVSAVIIMATVPFGLACAVVAMVLTGVSLNVYSQIGLVLLVGIMAKNGILIVEFANQLRDRGRRRARGDRGGLPYPPPPGDDDHGRDRARRRAAGAGARRRRRGARSRSAG